METSYTSIVYLYRPTTENAIITNTDNWIKHNHKKLFLIAGGTGITPIYQVIMHNPAPI